MWRAEICYPFPIALFQIPQYHYFYRTVIAVVEVTAPVDFSSILKAAFLHYPSGCRIINEEVTPNGIVAFLPEAIINQQPQGFCTDSLVPIGLSKPISGFHIVLANADITFSENIIADTSDWLVCGFQHNGPGMVVVENGSDYLLAFFHTFVWWPPCTRANFGVTGILKERFRIALMPWSDYQSFAFHNNFSINGTYQVPVCTGRWQRIRVGRVSSFICNIFFSANLRILSDLATLFQNFQFFINIYMYLCKQTIGIYGTESYQ
jgi:hypothetical protein